MRLDAQQLVVQALLRQRRAFRRDGNDIEVRHGAVGERTAGEQRLDADHGGVWRDRQRQRALDGAAAGFGHAHRDLRLERMRARRRLVEIDGEFRLAGIVGRRQIFERGFDRLGLLVGEAELITGEARPLLGDADRHVAFEIEPGGRRAIEEAPGDLDARRRLLRDRRGRRGQVELDAVGHIVLDQERRLADAGRFGSVKARTCQVPVGADRASGNVRPWPPRP